MNALYWITVILSSCECALLTFLFSAPELLWGLALTITAFALWPDDEAVRIAVGLRFGSELISPHSCRSSNLVDATGAHGLVCKHVPSGVVRHHALNECISRAFSAAGIPVKKEPAGLVQSDEKRTH